MNEGTYPLVTKLVSVLIAKNPTCRLEKGKRLASANQISDVFASGREVCSADYSASGTCWALSANQGDSPALAWGEAPLGVRYVSWNPSAKGGKACNATMAFGGPEVKPSRATLGAQHSLVW